MTPARRVDETPGGSAPPVPSVRRRVVSLASRLLSGLACLALVSATVPVARAVEAWRQQVSTQHETPMARFSAADLARYHAADRTDRPTAPLVLSYHDISPTPAGNPYVVTPRAFEAQMRMLSEAGYETLTAADFVRHLHDGRARGRSVLITFDDGTHGLWTYADRILARYGFHAVAFLITDFVGTHRPYYLSWREIARMHRSGRWDFGSHTSDLHHRIPIDSHGTLGSALANRRFLASPGKLEPLADYKRRVRADLEESIRDITGHRLPRPRLFVYPFSEFTDPVNSRQASRFLHRELRRLFAASLSNRQPHPGAVSLRAAAAELLERAEVTTTTTTADLFALLRSMSTLPVTRHDPAASPDRWLTSGGRPAPVRARGGVLEPDAPSDRFVRAAYAPQRTADWVDYRVRTRVARLDLRDGRIATGTLSARVGSARRIDVRVSDGTLEVTTGRRERTVHTERLFDSRSHSVSIRVGSRRTVVAVDGLVRYRQRVAPGPRSTGGIAVSAYRADPRTAFPVFTDLRVRPRA